MDTNPLLMIYAFYNILLFVALVFLLSGFQYRQLMREHRTEEVTEMFVS
nr:hypothetical protein [Neobacillus sp. 179.-C4.2 HS]